MRAGTSVAGKRDRWIPGCFILFFVCLAALEVWFVTLANRSFTGLVTDNAHTVGLAQREAEQRLGWTAAVAFEQGEDLDGRLTLRVRDADGRALVADAVRATAERMSRFPQIQTVRFDRQPGGEYVANLAVPLAGRWFIRIRIERDGQSIRTIEAIDVRP